MEYTKFPTIHKILLWKHAIHKHLEKLQFKNSFMHNLRTRIMELMDEKFVIEPIHKIATFLHPRYKMLKMLSPEEKESTYQDIKSHILNLSEPIDVMPEIPCKKSRFEEFEEENSFSYEHEFTLYVQTAKMNCVVNEDDKNLLLFWKENSNVFPKLAELARKTFMIPATSIASESNFSFAGLTMNNRRTNLKPEKLNQLLFLRSLKLSENSMS